jgi:serine phosphatase RsbU (regulator of sigma subunit)
MTAGPQLTSALVEWGVGARPLRGQSVSGDSHLVAPFEHGVLIAVIDGLGHGPEAAAAAGVAVNTLRAQPDEPVTTLVERCHGALQRTRGAVLSLASIDAARGMMTWIGVGNVDGTLYRAIPAGRSEREALPHRGGVVGFQLPALRPGTIAIEPGDTLVFATDGVNGTFSSESPLGWHPQDAADRIVSRHGKDTDDVLALVVRYSGPAS